MPLHPDTTLTLRIFSDELVPAEVTALVGCQPSDSHAKGDRNLGSKGREYAPRRIGMWRLFAPQASGDFEERALQLLQLLPFPSSEWDSVRSRHSIDLTIGLFMESSNEDLNFSSALVNALAERGIAINLDIYAPDDLEHTGRPDNQIPVW